MSVSSYECLLGSFISYFLVSSDLSQIFFICSDLLNLPLFRFILCIFIFFLYLCSTQRVQKRAFMPLELEFLIIVSHMWR